MPERGFMLKLTGAFLIGVIALVASVILVILLAPFIIPFLAALFPFLLGAMLFVLAVVLVWLFIYAFAMLGVAVYYVIKRPMKVSEKRGRYSIAKTREAGMRQKGRSGKK
jgi:small-conductance mechanosensitive channel